MDSTWSPYALDAQRTAQVFYYPSASPRDVLLQFDVPPVVELTQFVASLKQMPNEIQVRVAWNDELNGGNQPVAGKVLEIKLEGMSFWIGIIQAINDYRLESGTKQMTFIARTRDASPAWRDVRRVTDSYPRGTVVSDIITRIAYGLGMTDEEITIPSLGLTVVQDNAQLADLTPWQMFTLLMQPAGYEPFVNLRGQLKGVNRDTTRTADIVLADNTRLVRVGGSKSRPAATEVQINWLDPNLTRSEQQDQVLTTVSVTAGFFASEITHDVSFSTDRTQRVENSYMTVRHSCNGGIINVADESYTVIDDYGGQIKLSTDWWVPTLITGSMAVILADSFIPDLVVTVGIGASGGHTISVGRSIQAAAQLVLSITMASIGTGNYEIHGTPFDYVHARNTTTAYSALAQPWETQTQAINNDFVMDEAGSESFAIRELIYESRASFSYSVTIVDDPRVEVGDIVQLEDGSGVYVTGYTRDLSFGAPATLDIEGFYIPVVGS